MNPTAPSQAETIDKTKPLRPWHYFLLSLPFWGLLFPGIYSRWTPALAGIPFFYVYQFAWVLLSATLTAVVYRSIRR